MKKSILISGLALVAISFMAFNFSYWKTQGDITFEKEESFTALTDANDFVYSIDTRFLATISKSDLHEATSIIDIFPEGAADAHLAYQDVEITVLEKGCGKQKSVYGLGKNLNEEQLKLLKTVDYSSNIYVKAFYRKVDSFVPVKTNDHIIYYLTVTPEKEAEYEGGYDKLISYLREESKDEIAGVDYNQLQSGRVNFTVNKSGELDHIALESTSGYKDLDQTMLALLESISSNWIPAKNKEGQNVDQELVFLFGKMGC